MGLFDGAKKCEGLITDYDKWHRIVNSESFSFDFETEGKEFPNVKPLGFSLAIKEESTYVPLVDIRNELPNFNQRDSFKLLKTCAQSSQLKIAHNIPFDLRIFYDCGFEPKWPWFCTMIGAFVHDCTRHGLGLQEVCKRYNVGVAPDFSDFADKRTMSSFSVHDVGNYSIPHAEKTYSLYRLVKDGLICTRQYDAFVLDMKTVPSVIWMERCGVCIDDTKFDEIANITYKVQDELKQEILQELGVTINLDSGDQLAEVLYKQKGLKPLKFLEKSNRGSVDEDCLEYLVLQGFELASKIIEYRGCSKVRSTYVDGMRENIDNGRIHTSLSFTAARSGRFSSRSPNLQNIPTFDTFGIRSMFVPSSGYRFSVSDYSQIEMRLAAILSGDDKLLEIYKGDGDIHTATCKAIFGKVTPALRKVAKTINFAVGYGMGAPALAVSLNTTVKKAEKYLNSFWGTYSGFRAWSDLQVSSSRHRGFTSTLGGRRRILHDIDSKDFRSKSHDERVASNHVVQGTAAEVLKMAQVALHEHFKNTEVKMVLSVHDEVVLEAPKRDVEEVSMEQKRIMETVHDELEFNVPLLVETNIVDRWSDAK